MPHKNYCQQCVTDAEPSCIEQGHTVISDVADRSTYPIIEAPPVIIETPKKKKSKKFKKK